MIAFFEKWDQFLGHLILKNIKNPRLDSILSRVNRGEVFVIIIVYLLVRSETPYLLSSIFYISLIALANDRTVFWIKKKISRKRPTLQIMGKENNHPDLSHSFPSAHAANSMVACVLLTSLYSQDPKIYLFTVLAGLGRMCTLHHFLSDILGGWMIGLVYGISGVFFYEWFWKGFPSLNF